MLDSLEGLPGFDRDAFIAIHESAERITSIRINPSKINIRQDNGQPGIQSPINQLNNSIPWCPFGFYLQSRPSFTLDPLLHAGAYYVQEASSMLIWEILKQTIGEKINCKVLDLCAAPGGKSTLLSSYFKDGLVVSNEVIKQRVSVLYENITKWGNSNVVITNNDASDFTKLENYFDVMLIDAPCSGSGLFRKDESAVDEWSTENVNICSRRQQRIIADALPALKNNGLLIYSTCSYSKEENEDVLDWLLQEFELETIDLNFPAAWGVEKTITDKTKATGFRCWPYKLKGEGFFISVFKKKSGEDEYEIYQRDKFQQKKTADIERWIKTDTHITFTHKENIYAAPAFFANDIALLQKKLYVKKAGINCGIFKGHDFIPHHELAVSTLLNDAVERIPLSQEEALTYLRKNDLKVTTERKGWAIASYNNLSLGWMKLLPNRINNYYPAEWRILKQ